MNKKCVKFNNLWYNADGQDHPVGQDLITAPKRYN